MNYVVRAFPNREETRLIAYLVSIIIERLRDIHQETEDDDISIYRRQSSQ